MIFKDTPFPIGRLTAEGAAIYENIPIPSGPQKNRAVQLEVIRGTIPWAYFDGVSDINMRVEPDWLSISQLENFLKLQLG